MLDLAILGLLHESPMHGYELRKQLTTKLGAFRAAISYGSLYPTLRRLQTDGWITEEPAVECRRRRRGPAADEPSRPGRLQDHRRGQGALPGRCSPRPARRPTKTPVSACTSRSSPAPTRPPACASSKVAAARSRSAARACATRWPAPPSASTRTRWNCNDMDWTRASARSAGWRSSSPPSAPAAHPGSRSGSVQLHRRWTIRLDRAGSAKPTWLTKPINPPPDTPERP